MGSSAEIDPSITERARRLAPVVWLIGKVQSGKTSIVRELAQADEAAIGSGFRACTRSARVFDFPLEAPIIRFLDTRGLGEVDYDPRDDIAFCEERAHLIVAVAKAMDPAQETVLETVRAAKRRHADWPIVLVQTNLHEGYLAGQGHVLPYPFHAGGTTAAVPRQLVRALDYQRSLFSDVTSNCVAIDFTQPGDGLVPEDYGREALIEALTDAAPAAISAALSDLPDTRDASSLGKSNAHILGFALAAGASDALPVVGIAAVPAVQAAMLRRLAKLHNAHWDKRAYTEFAGALGAGVLVRSVSTFGLRQLVKLVPVYGQTAGAAAAAVASFATTYAIGKAASYYLTRRQYGIRSNEIASIYRAALREAFRLATKRRIGAQAAGAGQ
jgi:uncharacterized protein (DUF697 family)